MKIAQWGNSLAVRLPRKVVEQLDLKNGDDVEIRAAGGGVLELGRDSRRAQAMARIEQMSWPLPEDYKFDRDEIYDRFGPDSPGRKP